MDLITCANPPDKSKVGTKFALIVKDGKIYVSGLMQKGCCCYLTPTSSRSKETVTEEVIVEYLKNLKQRTLKLSEYGENKEAAAEKARVRSRRLHGHQARPPPLPSPYAAQLLNEGRGLAASLPPPQSQTHIIQPHHITSHQDKVTAHASMLVGERVGGLL